MLTVLIIVIAVVVIALAAGATLVARAPRRRRLSSPPGSAATDKPVASASSASAGTLVAGPPDTATGNESAPTDTHEVSPPTAAAAGAAGDVDAATTPTFDVPDPSAGRMVRLRGRLARSQSGLGRGLLAVLSRDHLDDDAWDEVEETLLAADVGLAATQEIVAALREKVAVLGARTPEQLRTLLRDELLAQVGTSMDRSLHTAPTDGTPGVVLVVGVNGTGKTTTCGKLARVLVADGRTVVLGAADTFRAAAADQLQTWGERVGASVVRGPEGGDPASVAFDAVKQGIDSGADTVLIDTAGRLHTKTGLMDELGKVKRVVERHGPITETLLVLDATTGQNGAVQAKVFTEAVEVTGIVLTKLDGTAKGGIVVSVQRSLGIPVKLVGLGEGPDDLAPFDPGVFVDALLDDSTRDDARAG